MGCLGCGRQLHSECTQPTEENECCCSKEVNVPLSQIGKGPGRPRHEDDSIGVSAGRKRAAAEYQINKEATCEWRGLANCGGGKFPIIGCVTGRQKHRHHGPVKDTSRNEPENVHMICVGCHNLWHAKNDAVYNEEEYNLLPHNPRVATSAEMLERAG